MAAHTQACPNAPVFAQADPPVQTANEKIGQDHALMLTIEKLLGTSPEYRPEIVSFMYHVIKSSTLWRDYNVINGTSFTTADEILTHATSTSDDWRLRDLFKVLGFESTYLYLKGATSLLIATPDRPKREVDLYQQEEAIFDDCERLIDVTLLTRKRLAELMAHVQSLRPEQLRAYCHIFRHSAPLDAERVFLDAVAHEDSNRLRYLCKMAGCKFEDFEPHLHLCHVSDQ